MRILAWGLLLAAVQTSYEPTSNYTVRQIEGWTVYVNNVLLNDKKEIGERVLRLLDVKLYDINRTAPASALERLHEIPIWLEFKDKDIRCACYHPSKQWLREHGFNPEKAGAVEIGNAETFLKWTLDQPSMVLHELAHAYHNRVLGDDNAEILAAYQRAVKSKTYESVLHFRGAPRRAYALNNAKEYFAELTEAYFGQNDFYPFVRAEVKEHDAEMFELLGNLWGEKKP